MRTPRLAAALVATALAVLPRAAAAQTTFAVTTTADTRDAVSGDGLCADADGACSLRAAVSEANARPGADTVDLPAGVYALARVAPAADDTNEDGDLDVTGTLVLVGTGAGQTFLDGAALRAASTPTQPGDRLLDVLAGATVEVSGLTVRNGGGNYPVGGIAGGGIRNRGSLTLRDAAVVGNRASLSTAGGGIWSTGTLRVERSLVARNEAGPASSAGRRSE